MGLNQEPLVALAEKHLRYSSTKPKGTDVFKKLSRVCRFLNAIVVCEEYLSDWNKILVKNYPGKFWPYKYEVRWRPKCLAFCNKKRCL